MTEDEKPILIFDDAVAYTVGPLNWTLTANIPPLAQAPAHEQVDPLVGVDLGLFLFSRSSLFNCALSRLLGWGWLVLVAVRWSSMHAPRSVGAALSVTAGERREAICILLGRQLIDFELLMFDGAVLSVVQAPLARRCFRRHDLSVVLEIHALLMLEEIHVLTPSS